MQQYPVKYIYNMHVDNWNRDLKKEEGKGHQKVKETIKSIFDFW